MSSRVEGARRATLDWRERVLAALSGEGIDHPAHIPAWRVYADSALVYFAPIYFFTLFVQLADLLYNFFETGALTLPESSQRRWFLATAPLFVLASLAYYLAFRPIHVLSPRRLRMAFGGTNALHALRSARHPPILYLRSFPFDERASFTGKWTEKLERNFGAGLIEDDTQEMKVVRSLRKFGPVLAIGRPGETRSPPGALRFYVRDDLWQAKIREIAPACRLVVLATGESSGLRWEIEHMIRTLPPHRLLLWPHVNVGRSSLEERRRNWNGFVEGLGSAFARPLPSWERVRNARYIVFDERWTPLCIPTEACRPSMWDRLTTRPTTYGLRAYMRAIRAVDAR